ncbi:MAG: hypothetical protein IJW27_08020 [Clostridia bacterium]|nr:hypothetical protein [Clostridia bacterium]
MGFYSIRLNLFLTEKVAVIVLFKYLRRHLKLVIDYRLKVLYVFLLFLVGAKLLTLEYRELTVCNVILASVGNK